MVAVSPSRTEVSRLTLRSTNHRSFAEPGIISGFKNEAESSIVRQPPLARGRIFDSSSMATRSRVGKSRPHTHMPWATVRGNPKSRAGHAPMWIGFASPDISAKVRPMLSSKSSTSFDVSARGFLPAAGSLPAGSFPPLCIKGRPVSLNDLTCGRMSPRLWSVLWKKMNEFVASHTKAPAPSRASVVTSTSDPRLCGRAFGASLTSMCSDSSSLSKRCRRSLVHACTPPSTLSGKSGVKNKPITARLAMTCK
mmetsp:Transcript_2539/g.5345  ORF Transcript_2539/g.5345 Transcript_2539/m.5345 type:complete len:252 (-) Transcript_2539:287-1042(-)